VIFLSDKQSPTNGEDIEIMRVARTTYEVASFFDGEVPLMELIKNILKRDARDVLRKLEHH